MSFAFITLTRNTLLLLLLLLTTNLLSTIVQPATASPLSSNSNPSAPSLRKRVYTIKPPPYNGPILVCSYEPLVSPPSFFPSTHPRSAYRSVADFCYQNADANAGCQCSSTSFLNNLSLNPGGTSGASAAGVPDGTSGQRGGATISGMRANTYRVECSTPPSGTGNHLLVYSRAVVECYRGCRCVPPPHPDDASNDIFTNYGRRRRTVAFCNWILGAGVSSDQAVDWARHGGVLSGAGSEDGGEAAGGGGNSVGVKTCGWGDECRPLSIAGGVGEVLWGADVTVGVCVSPLGG
ncbi:MAG: hypothetical protein M1827_004916 [Pycnora praestabilis]|nr:MAG: hypothetical protein M1827_004916 [Pycnora praestabilis]